MSEVVRSAKQGEPDAAAVDARAEPSHLASAVHRVRVNAFWMDRTPVTNREYRRFVEATGYVTWAEIPPDPKDYPGALPHMLQAGSLGFTRFSPGRTHS